MPDFPYPLGELDLDAMTPEDLLNASVHLRALSRYARMKHDAMRHRAAGRIAYAHQIEGRCQMIYQELPENWRW